METPDEIIRSDLEAAIALCYDDLKRLSGSRIFVTGGTGFIGSWLLDLFAWARHRLDLDITVVVLSRTPDIFTRFGSIAPAALRAKPHMGDVRNFSFPDGHFSHVFHAATAASARMNADSPLLMLDTIVSGTRRVLEFVVERRIPVFFQTSSGAVYGAQQSNLLYLNEEHTGAPNILNTASAYGEGKRVAELLGIIYSNREQFTHRIARIFAILGPRLPLDTHFAIGNFIKDCLMNQTICIRGDGTPVRSYLYIRDVLVWLISIFCRGSNNQAYNVGSEAGLTILETAQHVRTALSADVAIQIENQITLGQPGSRYVPSTQKIIRDLKVMQTVDMVSGIQRTAAWYQRKTEYK